METGECDELRIVASAPPVIRATYAERPPERLEVLMSSSVPDFWLEARKALTDAATALGGVESEPVVHAQVQATVGVGYAIPAVLHELQRLKPCQ